MVDATMVYFSELMVKNQRDTKLSMSTAEITRPAFTGLA